jgi:hypothetical protein
MAKFIAYGIIGLLAVTVLAVANELFNPPPTAMDALVEQNSRDQDALMEKLGSDE